MRSRVSSGSDHERVRASTRPVVEALVTSAYMDPVNQEAMRSGSSSMVREPRSAVAGREPSRASAMSWKTVLKSWTCRPLTAYTSGAGIASKSLSGIPRVRGER